MLQRRSTGGRIGPAGASDLARRIPAAAATLLCAAAAVTVAVTLAAVYDLHVPLPYWDEWYTLIHFRKFAEGSYGLSDLAAQHNEHRIFFPRLFFFADELLFGLSGLLNATVTVLLQAVNAGVLIGLMSRVVARPAHRALLAGFVVLMLFTLRQEQNFTNGFQLQFVGVFTAAALAGVAYVAALGRLRDRRGGSAFFFALATLGCFVSAYTMANGVMAGFVLAAVALLGRAPWPVPAVTAALSAALAALFFHAYVPGGDSLPFREALARPLPYLSFVAAYLGNPLDVGLRATLALGALGLLLAAGAAWRVAAGRTRDGASLALLALAGFVLASAAATAYGRIALGTEQAAEDRYATPSLLFWCALVVFWFPVAVGPPRRVATAGLGALVVLLSAAALTAEATGWRPLAERAAGLRRVSDSLISGLYDAEAAATYDIATPDIVASFIPFLRKHRLAAFADPDAAALGRPLAALGRLVASRACDGTAAARPDPALGPGGVKLSGTAWDGDTRRAPHRIVVADASGIVIGFGSASLPGQPPQLWTAYARTGNGETLHTYARLADGALCGFADATVGGSP